MGENYIVKLFELKDEEKRLKRVLDITLDNKKREIIFNKISMIEKEIEKMQFKVSLNHEMLVRKSENSETKSR